MVVPTVKQENIVTQQGQQPQLPVLLTRVRLSGVWNRLIAFETLASRAPTAARVWSAHQESL
jgi:hypothetical protein